MSSKNNAVVVKVVKATDKSGKPTDNDLMLIGTQEKIENRKALAFQAGKAADLLAVLEDEDGGVDVASVKELIGSLRSMVANHRADVRPAHTLKIGDRTYGLFGTRIIKVQQTRHLDGKDGPPTILYVKMRDTDPYADVLKPEHFGPNAVPVPIKDIPSKSSGRKSTADVVAETIAAMNAANDAKMAAMMAAFQQTMAATLATIKS